MILAFFLFLLSSASSCEKGTVMNMASFFPEEINGWKKSDVDRSYNRGTIFDYIDGGGEIYLTYSFQEVIVRKFMKPGDAELTAEIFDMGTPADAFGIFSFEREGDDAGIGQDSEYEPGLLRFWKGKFFVAVSSEQETPTIKQGMIGLGRSISERIKETGKRPEILDYLPGEGLVIKKVRSFHKPFNLNYHYFVAEKNILNLDERTDALLAPYLLDGSRSYLLIVAYENAEKSQEAYRSFTNAYMPDAKNLGVVQIENKKWTAADRKENFIIIVFDAPSREASIKLIDDARNAVTGKDVRHPMDSRIKGG